MTRSPDASVDARIVCLAASAGGLEALTAFVGVLSPGFSAPIVVAQHLSPTHRSLLAPLLARASVLPVVELTDRQTLEAGVIHIVPENTDAVLEGTTVRLTLADGSPGPHPSANKLFESAAASWGKMAVGVVLSGTGSDGADGASAIDDLGGVVLAQDGDSAKYWSMPKAVIDRGLARAVLPPEMLAQAIQDLLRDGTLHTDAETPEEPDAIERLAAITERDFDFGLMNYKTPTLRRRIGARMAARGSATLDDYAKVVRENPDEGRRLVDALLIRVTALFRDRSAFDTLRVEARRLLTEASEENRPLRVWCAGCCTGEEAYTLAILLDQEASSLTQPVQFQIFATDLSETYITQARRGFFAADQLLDANKKELATYFSPVARGYRVIERLRDRIVFARHDLIRSTPFMNIDLASCRNLLIYFKPEAQQAALTTLATALRQDGVLFLGQSETTGEQQKSFTEISRSARIFRRTSYSGQRIRHPVSAPAVRRPRLSPAGGKVAPESDQERLLNALYTQGPPTFLIDVNDQLIASCGDLSRLIAISPGQFPSTIYGLIEEAAHLSVRITILACRKEGTRQVGRVFQRSFGGEEVRWRAVASLADADNAKGEIVLTFEEVHGSSAPVLKKDSFDPAIESLSLQADELRDELIDTRRQLRTVIEELEVSNEELQAANEELLSSNEEFQATNEELETTNEELQATNEELETVNDELTTKNLHIAELNEDLAGVHESLTSPLFVFDSSDLLKSMNSAAVTLLKTQGDGRRVERLSDLRALPSGKKIIDVAQSPTSKRGKHTGRIRQISMNGDEFQARITHYGDGERLERVIILQDVTELVAAKRDAMKQKRMIMELEVHQRALLDGIASQTALLDEKGNIIAVNKAWREFAQANNYDGDDFALGSNYLTVCEQAAGACSDEAAEVATELRKILKGPQTEATIDYPCHAPGQERWFQCVIRAVESEGRRAAVVMHVDNTRQHALQARLQKVHTAETQLSQAKSAFLANMSHELRTPLTAIIGFGNVMEAEIFGPVDNPKYSQYIHDIVQSAEHLLAIITEIMDFNRYESGKLEGATEHINLRDALTFAAEITRAAFTKTALDITIHTPDNAPVVEGNDRLLRQAFINILSNAAKALGNSGKITIDVQQAGLKGLVLRFEDDGPGVPDDMLLRMFEPFEQGDREVNHTPDRGLGLGLAIVKAVIDRHQGEVRAYNRESGGLGIEISLPNAAFIEGDTLENTEAA